MDLATFAKCCEEVSEKELLTEEERQNFISRICPKKDTEGMTEEEKRAYADKVADAAAEALVENFNFKN